MNIIKHFTYRLEFSTWDPFEKQTLEELDDMVNRLKCKHLLAHAGKVKLVRTSEEIVCQEKAE